MLFEQIERHLERKQRERTQGVVSLAPMNDNKKPLETPVLNEAPTPTSSEPPAEASGGKVCGIMLPPLVHAGLKRRALANKTNIKTEALAAIQRDLARKA